MSILNAIRELGWQLPPHPECFEEQEFDPHTGEGKIFLYKTDACNFEVLDGRNWYKIDVRHPYPELYEGTNVPSHIVSRAASAYIALSVPDPLFWEDDDPVPRILDALRKEFDDARFVNMTIIPGAIY